MNFHMITFMYHSLQDRVDESADYK